MTPEQFESMSSRKQDFFDYFNSEQYDKELTPYEKLMIFYRCLRDIPLNEEILCELLTIKNCKDLEVWTTKKANQMREDLSSLQELIDDLSTKIQDKSDNWIKF